MGPESFFDKIFFKSFLLQFISQKTKHPFFGKPDKNFFNDSKLLISGIEIRFDCSEDSTIIFFTR